jgi:hypothetical protein
MAMVVEGLPAFAFVVAAVVVAEAFAAVVVVVAAVEKLASAEDWECHYLRPLGRHPSVRSVDSEIFRAEDRYCAFHLKLLAQVVLVCNSENHEK